MIKIEFCNEGDERNLPSRGSQYAAAFDLKTNERFSLEPGEHRAIGTGVKMAIQNGYKGIIKPRSGLALNNAIDVLAGVIDSDYRGEVKVILINHGKQHVHFKRYDRIAQIMFEKVPEVEMIVVQALDDTVRGSGGFGSTGSA